MSSVSLASSPVDLRRIESLVADSVRSEHSKRAYAAAVTDFFSWWQRSDWPILKKATVQQYRAELEKRPLAPASINIRLSAIRKFVSEAADNGLLSRELAIGIAHIKGSKVAGVRTGHWLAPRPGGTASVVARCNHKQRQTRPRHSWAAAWLRIEAQRASATDV